MAWMTLQIIRLVLPRHDLQHRLFLFSMWGGGLLCAASMAANFIN